VSLATQAGDTVQLVRALTYLTLCLRRKGYLSETGSCVKRAMDVATASGLREYIGSAHAHSAWISIRNSDLTATIEHAKLALDFWKAPFVFPFQWTALIPLLEAEYLSGHFEKSIECVETIMAQTQQRLPGAVSESLRSVLGCWSDSTREKTAAAIGFALGTMEQTGHR